MKTNPENESILIVDDTADNLRILQQILEPEGYTVFTVKSGETAIEVTEQTLPALILLDVMMPGLNGFGTLQRLQSNPDTEKVPVIFITAKTEPIDVEKYFTAGAADYISKPFSQLEVCHRVRMHLNLQERRLPGKQNTPCSPGETADLIVNSLRQDASRYPITVQIPSSVLPDLALSYLNDLRKEIPQLENALLQKDFESIISMAHDYSGSGASYGFSPITYLGRAMEYAAEHKQDMLVTELVGSFRDYIERVQLMENIESPL